MLARRPPLNRTLLLAAAWIAIFSVGLLIAGQRERFGALIGHPVVEGSEVRIAMASDGHFWVDATINGICRRMLIDSGATMSAVSVGTARAAGLEEDSPFPTVIDTANGQVTARTATAGRVAVGELITRDLHVAISSAFGDTDVLGMNFLSRLTAWRVEGRTLVLTPTKPSS